MDGRPAAGSTPASPSWVKARTAIESANTIPGVQASTPAAESDDGVSDTTLPPHQSTTHLPGCNRKSRDPLPFSAPQPRCPAIGNPYPPPRAAEYHPLSHFLSKIMLIDQVWVRSIGVSKSYCIENPPFCYISLKFSKFSHNFKKILTNILHQSAINVYNYSLN